jgi:hypothetical protein
MATAGSSMIPVDPNAGSSMTPIDPNAGSSILPVDPNAGKLEAVVAAESSVAKQTPMQAFVYKQSIYTLERIRDRVAASNKDLMQPGGQERTAERLQLQVDYTTLLSEINIYLAIAGSKDATTINTDIINFRSRESALNSRFNAIAGVTGFFDTFKQALHYYITYSLQIFGPLLTIVIIVNMYASKAIAYKVLFSIWGVIWYPLVLFVGIFDPPVWRELTFSVPKTPEAMDASKLYLRIMSGIMFTCFLYAFVLYMLPV